MRFAFAVLGLVLAACSGNESASSPGGDASASDANPDAPDFSGLDPAKCPAATAEDLHGFDSAYALRHGASYEEDRAFYVLTLLDAEPAVASDTTLSGLADQRVLALGEALATCNDDAACLADAGKLSSADVTTAGDALVALASPVAAELRKSGTAQLHASGNDAELLRAAWQDAASTLNQGWDAYVTPMAAADRKAALDAAIAAAPDKPFYRLLLDAVLAGLAADGRDEASRYEPLADGENTAVIAHIPAIDFAKYPFSVIVVPGKGPGDLDHPLDPGGQIRADQAALRFQAGLAPLVALSGGHVHPDRTPYAEAIQMKKYLMETYAIPEDAIIVDPHARHTTTNLRNVARQLYRYGVPVDRPSIITTDLFQTLYIAAASDTGIMGKRCLDELGYKPYRGITKLDDLDDCWIPAVESMQEDARDLLDP